MDSAAISKLKGNVPLTETDVEELVKALWKEVGTRQDYEAVYGAKPLGEFVRGIVDLFSNQNVWADIRTTIERVNANAAA